MDTEILLEIKPKYIDWVRTFSILCSPGCITTIIMFLCGFPITALVAELLMELLNINFVISLIITIILFLSLFLAGFALALFFDRKNYEVTTYRVFSDRIEFEEGFINHKYTTIRMADIKEIHLDQNFIQRKAELGTIRFTTAANNSTTNTGICFRDIQNSMAIYAKIKQIHENC